MSILLGVVAIVAHSPDSKSLRAAHDYNGAGPDRRGRGRLRGDAVHEWRTIGRVAPTTPWQPVPSLGFFRSRPSSKLPTLPGATNFAKAGNDFRTNDESDSAYTISNVKVVAA